MLKCTDKYFTQSTPGCFFKTKKNKQTIQEQENNAQLVQVIQKLQLVLFSLKEQSQKVLRYSKHQIQINQARIKLLQANLEEALQKNNQLQKQLKNNTNIEYQNNDSVSSIFLKAKQQIERLYTKHQDKIDFTLSNDILKLKSFFQLRQKKISSQKEMEFKQQHKIFSNLSTDIKSNQRSDLQHNGEQFIIDEEQNSYNDQQRSQSNGQNQGSFSCRIHIIDNQLRLNQVGKNQNTLVTQLKKLCISNLKQCQNQWLFLQSKNSNFTSKLSERSSFCKSQIYKLKEPEPIYLEKHLYQKNKQNQINQYSLIQNISKEVKLYYCKLQNLFKPLPANLLRKKIQIPHNIKRVYLNRVSGIQERKLEQRNTQNHQASNLLDKSFRLRSNNIENILKEKIINKQNL